jgi:hypothetical protein
MTPPASAATTAIDTPAVTFEPRERTYLNMESMKRRPSVKMRTTKRARPPKDTITRSSSIPPAATPERTARMSQPTASLAMAAASVICPKLRRSRPRSLRIFPTTGSADTDRARAKNIAKTQGGGSASPENRSARAKPSAPVAAIGSRSDPAATARATLRKRAMMPRSVS